MKSHSSPSEPKIKKGILLAGGSGSRLFPLTTVTNKHLLPIFNKPMIYYPLTAIMLAGVRDILVISSPKDLPQFRSLLGSGAQWGIQFSYAEQEAPEGLAQAFLIGESFINGDPVCLNLGDHILYGDGLPERLQRAASQDRGATVFGHYTSKPESYGVVVLDEDGRPVKLVEKPSTPVSNIAVCGIYFYDSDIVDIAKQIRPSPRGELEITDVNRAYLERGDLTVDLLGRGYAWFDGGTPDLIMAASQYVQIVETAQDVRIASPEEVALRMGFIDDEQFESLVAPIATTPYGRYLMQVRRLGL